MTATATDTMTETLLSVERLAAEWDVHADTIKALIRSGALRASRVGKQFRVRPSDAQAYLDSTVVA